MFAHLRINGTYEILALFRNIYCVPESLKLSVHARSEVCGQAGFHFFFASMRPLRPGGLEEGALFRKATLSERAHLFQNVLDVSICFHAEALSNTPTRKVAHSLQYPIEVTNNGITLLTGLVYNLPYGGRGIKLCLYMTQPQNCQALASASRMM